MSLRELETSSIREFLEQHADRLSGRVLDYGCGMKLYRGLVERAGAVYCPFDRMSYPGSVTAGDWGNDDPCVNANSWDGILCTQVIQYVNNPQRMLFDFRYALKPGGVLLLTGPTNWPIVEKDDLHRFTPSGIEKMLRLAEFDCQVTDRASATFEGESWLLGWGAVAA